MNEYERYFYHAFPRPGEEEPEESVVTRGLLILERIIDTGLLLTPETITIPKEIGENKTSDLHILQRRICFTELSPTEVQKHAIDFGPFALEFYPDHARRLGAIPVIYIPQPTTGSSHQFDHFGFFIAHRLADIQGMLTVFADMEQQFNETEGTSAIEVLNHEQGVLFSVSNQTFRALRDCLIPEYARFRDLESAVRGISGIMYTTDSDYKIDARLSYYRQREWRILGDLTSYGRRNSKTLSEEDKSRISKGNSKYFLGMIQTPEGVSMKRIDLCRILAFPSKEPLIELVRRVIVPNVVYPAIHKYTFLDKLRHKVRPLDALVS